MCQPIPAHAGSWVLSLRQPSLEHGVLHTSLTGSVDLGHSFHENCPMVHTMHDPSHCFAGMCLRFSVLGVYNHPWGFMYYTLIGWWVFWVDVPCAGDMPSAVVTASVYLQDRSCCVMPLQGHGFEQQCGVFYAL